MKGLFIPEITAEMFRNGSLESIESLMAEGQIYDIEHSMWIPVSERLPELKQHVLLSCYGRVIYKRMISEDGNSGYPVFEICYSVGDKRPVVLETTVHSEYTTSRIKAWMPLPKEYKAESEE